MDDHASGEDRSADITRLPVESESGEAIEAYETAEGIVFYDGENPLAWLQSSEVVELSDNR